MIPKEFMCLRQYRDSSDSSPLVFQLYKLHTLHDITCPKSNLVIDKNLQTLFSQKKKKKPTPPILINNYH